MRARLRRWMQHRFNELHLYCRLKDCGLCGEAAKRWSRKIGGWFKSVYGESE